MGTGATPDKDKVPETGDAEKPDDKAGTTPWGTMIGFAIAAVIAIVSQSWIIGIAAVVLGLIGGAAIDFQSRNAGEEGLAGLQPAKRDISTNAQDAVNQTLTAANDLAHSPPPSDIDGTSKNQNTREWKANLSSGLVYTAGTGIVLGPVAKLVNVVPDTFGRVLGAITGKPVNWNMPTLLGRSSFLDRLPSWMPAWLSTPRIELEFNFVRDTMRNINRGVAVEPKDLKRFINYGSKKSIRDLFKHNLDNLDKLDDALEAAKAKIAPPPKVPRGGRSTGTRTTAAPVGPDFIKAAEADLQATIDAALKDPRADSRLHDAAKDLTKADRERIIKEWADKLKKGAKSSDAPAHLSKEVRKAGQTYAMKPHYKALWPAEAEIDKVADDILDATQKRLAKTHLRQAFERHAGARSLTPAQAEEIARNYAEHFRETGGKPRIDFISEEINRVRTPPPAPTAPSKAPTTPEDPLKTPDPATKGAGDPAVKGTGDPAIKGTGDPAAGATVVEEVVEDASKAGKTGVFSKIVSKTTSKIAGGLRLFGQGVKWVAPPAMVGFGGYKIHHGYKRGGPEGNAEMVEGTLIGADGALGTYALVGGRVAPALGAGGVVLGIFLAEDAAYSFINNHVVRLAHEDTEGLISELFKLADDNAKLDRSNASIMAPRISSSNIEDIGGAILPPSAQEEYKHGSVIKLLVAKHLIDTSRPGWDEPTKLKASLEEAAHNLQRLHIGRNKDIHNHVDYRNGKLLPYVPGATNDYAFKPIQLENIISQETYNNKSFLHDYVPDILLLIEEIDPQGRHGVKKEGNWQSYTARYNAHESFKAAHPEEAEMLAEVGRELRKVQSSRGNGSLHNPQDERRLVERVREKSFEMQWAKIQRIAADAEKAGLDAKLPVEQIEQDGKKKVEEYVATLAQLREQNGPLGQIVFMTEVDVGQRILALQQKQQAEYAATVMAALNNTGKNQDTQGLTLGDLDRKGKGRYLDPEDLKDIRDKLKDNPDAAKWFIESLQLQGINFNHQSLDEVIVPLPVTVQRDAVPPRPQNSKS